MKKKKEYRSYPLNRERKQSILATTAGLAVVVILFFFFGGMFFSNYARLNNAIRQERTDYIKEISSQIITNQLFMKNHYKEEIIGLAEFMNTGLLTDKASIKKYLENDLDGRILLVDDRNYISDLNGSSVFLNPLVSLHDIEGRGTFQTFVKLNFNEDYWLFVAPLNNVKIDGEIFKAVILSIPAGSFRDNLAITLFDQQGFAFLTDSNGDVGIRAENMDNSFIGDNLFDSLLEAGVDSSKVEFLRQEIADEIAGGETLKIDGTEWIISYDYLDAYNEIIVMVPLTVIAANTYTFLKGTVWNAILLVAVFCFWLLFIMVAFSWHERERQKKLMAIAAKNEFLSKMSHDIRTPLNAVIGMELLARRNIDKPEIASEYLNKSHSAADYLLGIINDVLDMSKIESGKMELSKKPFDLNKLIRDVDNIVTALATEKNLQFISEYDIQFGSCYIGDRIRLRQILINLLSNAVKFTKNNGLVRLKVTGEKNQNDGVDFTFVVSDSGIGMSEDYLPNIFTPFVQEHSTYTEKYAGSGLGLAIVNELVSLMNGTITVTSKENIGSTFTVNLTLPIGDEKALSVENSTPNEDILDGKNILVAEDNAINQEIMIAILADQFKMNVTIAENGLEAVQKFNESESFHFDVILMDIKMPVMDGLEATREIRKLSRQDATMIPIIALSANSYSEDVRASLEAGMNAYLSKPIDVEELTEALALYFINTQSEKK